MSTQRTDADRIEALELQVKRLKEALELCRDYSASVAEEYRSYMRQNDTEVSTGLARFWAAKRIADGMRQYADRALAALPDPPSTVDLDKKEGAIEK